MIKILENSIDFSKLGNYEKEHLKAEVKRAVLLQESKVLELELDLNFVLPVEQLDLFKRSLVAQLPGIEDVKLLISYSDLMQTVEEALPLYISHMIHIVNGRFAHVTRTIEREDCRLEDGVLTIYALGELSVQILNRDVASEFQKLLKRDLGLEAKVVFENQVETYKKAGKHVEEKERRAVEEQLDEFVKQRQRRGSRPAAPGNSPGGGFAKEAGGSGGGFNGGGNGSGSGFNGGQGGFKRRKRGYVPVKGNVIMGSAVYGPFLSIGQVNSESGVVCIEGEMFKKDSRTTKSDSKLVTLFVTDKRTSICIKAFVVNQKWDDIDNYLSAGDGVKIKGQAQWDRFDNCTVIMADSIEKTEKKERMDTYPEKRVELHAHTKMSAMDGLNDAKRMVKTAEKWGHKAVAITDHGVVQAFPEASHAGKDIKILYGCEGYLLEDKDLIAEDGTINYKGRPTNHVIVFAKNKTGLKNLYRLVSMSHLNYFYKKPRMPKSVLTKYREGLIIGSACEAGEVYQAILHEESEEELKRLVGFLRLSGDPAADQQPFSGGRRSRQGRGGSAGSIVRSSPSANSMASRWLQPAMLIISMPRKLLYRRIIMAGQGFKDVEGDEGLYFRTTDEMMEEFMYLGEEKAYEVVITNANKIADEIESMMPVPDGKFPPKIEGAEEDLRKACEERAANMYGSPLPQEIRERLDKELNSIIDNGYAVMYRSAELLVKKSLSDGYLVGSRGSVGSSFAATMSGITEVNPLPPHYLCPNCKHLEWGDKEQYDCGVDMPDKVCPECGTPYRKEGFTIPFETFLGFEANKEPDIDLNFAGGISGHGTEICRRDFR